MSDLPFPFGREVVTFGAGSAPIFRTQITETFGGYEQRNRVWAYGLRRFAINLKLLTAAERQTLLIFFDARGGSHDSFLLTDPTDPGDQVYRVRFENDELAQLAEIDPLVWQIDSIPLVEVRE